ncbi:LuxR C-terminal-related transcriptional regulator [Nocardia sp. NPDC059240]|uniref:LuxR C-terminal-related transcriptional regulator n=1 Tax=Nocardia sp. NPDC059240 TaxID=3346786 RepID=UPI0036CD605B
MILRGKTVRRVLIITAALIFAVFVFAAPSAERSVVVVAAGIGVLIAGTGLYVCHNEGIELDGLLLVAAGFAWIAAELHSRTSGPYPLLAALFGPVGPLLLVAAFFAYPGTGLADTWERWYVLASCGWVVVTNSVLVFLKSPFPPPPGAWWPMLPGYGRAFVYYLTWSVSLSLALIGTVLVLRRWRREPVLQRRELLPILIVGLAATVEIAGQAAWALTSYSVAPVSTPLAVHLVGTFAAAVVPLAFLLSDRRRLADHRNARPPNRPPETDIEVRSYIRKVLRDEGLALYRRNSQGHYVNIEADGPPLPPDPSDPADRPAWARDRVKFSIAYGDDKIAVALGVRPLGRRDDLVEQVMRSAADALRIIDLKSNPKSIATAAICETIWALNKRELEILEGLADHLGNDLIGKKVGLSETRVANTLTTIYKKLGLDPDKNLRTQATMAYHDCITRTPAERTPMNPKADGL